ncbi:hypothetical protein [Roseivirga sp. E12]|uniref:hypothetical protein n=1 Tax=Roseivirga sp. E12 TaxID=2819237 RepID=UPI001ABC62E3|nr:hypothetical protein [Roseivirga sp. E12]MBO3700364.1 hypothetical protein [Roseivirga sp. E12]
MKGKLNDRINTRPLLDRLKVDYKLYLKGDLVQTITEQPIDSFEGDEIEFIFQLIEAELRATDAAHIKEILSSIKESVSERWAFIFNHSLEIERGRAQSAVSHQLIALIQLTEEH